MFVPFVIYNLFTNFCGFLGVSATIGVWLIILGWLILFLYMIFDVLFVKL